MYWTLELASKLEDAPWPATKDELIDYAVRSGAPLEVLENLQEIEDEGEIYESIEDIWPDYPSKDDFFFNEESAQDCQAELQPEGEFPYGDLSRIHGMSVTGSQVHKQRICLPGRVHLRRRQQVES